MKFGLHLEERMIFLGITVCALVGLFGYSFAYFLSGTKIVGSGGDVKGSTATLTEVTYDAGEKEISLLKAAPGANAEKNFSVSIKPGSNPEEEVTYEIFLNVETNEFKKCSDESAECTSFQELTYQFNEDGSEAKSGDLAGYASGLISLGKFTHKPQNEPYNYTFSIKWNDANFDQGYNKGATFKATILVKFADKDE